MFVSFVGFAGSFGFVSFRVLSVLLVWLACVFGRVCWLVDWLAGCVVVFVFVCLVVSVWFFGVSWLDRCGCGCGWGRACRCGSCGSNRFALCLFVFTVNLLCVGMFGCLVVCTCVVVCLIVFWLFAWLLVFLSVGWSNASEIVMVWSFTC